MRVPFPAAIFLLGFFGALALAAPPDKPVWPLTLREALPVQMTGWVAAPRDELPDEDENVAPADEGAKKVQAPQPDQQLLKAVEVLKSRAS